MLIRRFSYLFMYLFVAVVMLVPSTVFAETLSSAEQSLTAAKWFERGVYFYTIERKPQEAIEAFTKAIECDSVYVEAYAWRGNSKRLLKRYPDAISDFNRALQLSPDSSLALAMRAATYAESGNFSAASADCDKVLSMRTINNATAYNYLGMAYDLMNQYQRAIECYNKAILLEPKNIAAYNNRGLSYKQLGQWEQAILNYSKAIEVSPQFATAYYNRGNVYRLNREWKQAISDFNKTIELNPQYPDVYITRGEVLMKTGNGKDAEADLIKAIGIDPFDGSAYFYLAQVYEHNGQKSEALENYRLANKFISSIDDQPAKQKIGVRLQGDWTTLKEWILLY